MTERTLVLVKPDGVRLCLVGEVVGRFERRGFTLRGLKALRIDRALAERHYAEVEEARRELQQLSARLLEIEEEGRRRLSRE